MLIQLKFVTAIVDNKFQFKATISKVETDGDKPNYVRIRSAGNDYTEGNIGIFGAGTGAEIEVDEFRDNAVNRIRILDLDDPSGDLGGSGYTIATNTAQAGTSNSITIAAQTVSRYSISWNESCDYRRSRCRTVW